MGRVYKHSIGPLRNCTTEPVNMQRVKEVMKQHGAIYTLLCITKMTNIRLQAQALQLYATVNW